MNEHFSLPDPVSVSCLHGDASLICRLQHERVAILESHACYCVSDCEIKGMIASLIVCMCSLPLGSSTK